MNLENALYVVHCKKHWAVYRYTAARASFRSESLESALAVARRLAAKDHLILLVQDC